MEDAFEFIIYLIFIVLSLVGGLYKNYTKKKAEERQRQQTPSQVDQQEEYTDVYNDPFEEYDTEPKRNPFEEFIRQQLEGAETETVLEEPTPQPYVETETQKPEFSKTQVASAKEGNAVFESTNKELISDELLKHDFSISEHLEKYNDEISDVIGANEIKDENQLLDEFDLKKAVIYSEIIRRPDH